MLEDFIINNIKLSVNPTDIVGVQKRNLKTYQYIRDDSSYTTKSKFLKNLYTVVVSFDSADSIQLKKLAYLCTELDKYPFAFIKSNRLESFVGFPSKIGKQDYFIYGVRDYTLSQFATAQGHIVLTLNLLFFNHLPFTPGYRFRDFEIVEDVCKRPDIETGPSTKPVKKLRWGPKLIDFGDESPEADAGIGDDLFGLYFRRDQVSRHVNALKYGPEKPLTYFSCSYPFISTGTPVDPENYETIKVFSAPEPDGEHANEDQAATTVYHKWEKSIDIKTGATNLNSGDRALAVVQITKSNNFAQHNLSGWTQPILQYMGKGLTTFQFKMEGDSGVGDQNSFDHPVSALKHAMQRVDINFEKNRAHSAINVLKFDCLLLDLCPVFGFALENEQLNTSANNQGRDSYTYVFRDSDTRNLLDRSRYKSVGNKNVDVQIEIMIQVIKDVLTGIKKTNRWKHKVEGVALWKLVDLSDDALPLLDPNSEEIFDILETLNENLMDIRYQIIAESNGYANYKTMAYVRALDNPDPSNFTVLSTMLDERINPSSGYKADYIYRYDSIIQDSFYKILNQASKGNQYAAYANGFVDKIKNNYGQLVNDFEGEAIEDLRIDESLGVSAGALERYGLTEARDFSPFFFLEYAKHFTAKELKMGFDGLAGIITNEVVNKINKLTPKGGENQLKISQSSQEFQATDLSEVKIDKTKHDTEDVLPFDVSKQDDIFKSNELDQVDPFDINDQAIMHTKRMTDQMSQGINQAFPTIKVYLVEGDEKSLFSNFKIKEHAYYEVKGLSELDVVTNDDMSPVDLLQMCISNPGSVYTDEHIIHDANSSIKIPELRGTEGENAFPYNRLRVRVGNRLHVKAGYGNDPNALETIFNGLITGVGPKPGHEEQLFVEAEGFGRELISYEHGDDPTEDNFMGSADTKSIVANALYSEEIEHFGTLKLNPEKDKETRSLLNASPFGIFAYSYPTRLFTNIYIDSIISGEVNGQESSFWDLVGDITDAEEDYDQSIVKALNPFDGKQIWYDFPIYRSTPWSMLKEMEFRHPQLISKPVLYGDRASYFFGIKEQLYVYRDLANEIMRTAPFITNLSAEKDLYSRFRKNRFKPVCDMHIINSDTNIINNSLKVTSDFNTVVNVQYYDDAAGTILTDSPFEDNDFHHYEMKVDDNLKTYEHRRGELAMLGIHGRWLAYRYGSVYLRNELEKMYDGNITVVGNPYMKAGDYATLNDDYRGLNGIIKIRSCVHSFSVENGYVCRITPGLYAESSHKHYSDLFLNLHIASEASVNLLRLNSQISMQTSQQFIATRDINSVINGGLLNFKEAGDVSLFSEEAAGAAGRTALDILLVAAIPLRGLSHVMGTSYLRNILINDAIAWVAPNLHAAGAPQKWINAAQVVTHLDDALTAGKVAGASSLSATRKIFNISKAMRAGKGMKNMVNMGKVLGVGAQSAVLGAGSLGKAGIGVVRLMGPIGWIATIAISLFTSKIEEVSLTRQPVKVYPLKLHGREFLGGVNGFVENGYFESLADNVSETIDSTRSILSQMYGSMSSSIE